MQLWKVARREVFKGKYKESMRLESQARVMWMHQLAVPGLFQTEDYAREVLSAARTTETNGDLRRPRRASAGKRMRSSCRNGAN
ncbi:Scr1 family TA system antitoxin-like transcriptional regulator [[Kitasatospora] papulosa]|uniref:Scr1 family TA system antitoxin-like transcriptional regulator n=1 Tax=[Kitasatospora] papulosa TaxID=1464011 RepID=UPI003697D953